MAQLVLTADLRCRRCYVGDDNAVLRQAGTASAAWFKLLFFFFPTVSERGLLFNLIIIVGEIEVIVGQFGN